jgi:hypothetical protein
VGEITVDNELLYAKIEALEGKRPLAHRGRDDEPDTSPSLARWYGMARVARVWKFSRASVYRSRKDMPPNTSGRRPGPGAHAQTRNWQSISAST